MDLFCEGLATTAGEADAVGRSAPEVGGQLVPAAADGLRVQAGDGRHLVEPAVPEPLGLQGGDPPTLLLVEPAEDQVEAAVPVGDGTGASPAVGAGARVDGTFHAEISW